MIFLIQILIIIIFTTVVAQGTISKVSDDTHILLGGGTGQYAVEVTTDPWPLDPTEKISIDGSRWISFDADGGRTTFPRGVPAGDYLFISWVSPIPYDPDLNYQKSRVTFWGSADDSIVEVCLSGECYPVDYKAYMADTLVRVDLTETTLLPGLYYPLIIRVKNIGACRLGLCYYLSIDYDIENQFAIEWISGYNIYSLPVRLDSEYEKLEDVFTDASGPNAFIYDVHTGGWNSIPTDAILSPNQWDSLRTYSFYMQSGYSGSQIITGWGIQEQRYLDLRSDNWYSAFIFTGSVAGCDVPFKYWSPYFHPDDLPDETVYSAGQWVPSTGTFSSTTNYLYPLHGNYTWHNDGGSAYTSHLDLKCSGAKRTESEFGAVTRLDPENLPEWVYEYLEEKPLQMDTSCFDGDTSDVLRDGPPKDGIPRWVTTEPPSLPLSANEEGPAKRILSEPEKIAVSSRALPNPFNSVCRIEFYDSKNDVWLEIFDLSGRKVSDVIEMKDNWGVYTAYWNPETELKSGIYFYRIRYNTGELKGKLYLIR